MPSPSVYTVPVPEDKAGMRLDRFLADAVPALSRTRLKALIEAGRVAGAGSDPAYKVKAFQSFTVAVPAPEPATPRPEAIPLNVLYEDDDLIVIDKPAGLVVHPAPGHYDGTLVNALLAHCGGSLSGIGGVSRPGIVHRLDKDTSGVMVVAKNDAAHRHLSEQFAGRSLERAYYALVWGVPNPRRGEIEGNIGRNPVNRKKMAIVKRGGKPALTRYEVLKSYGTLASLVECRLATGRTHQVRVHMTALGHPVIGDPLYGGGAKNRLKGASETLKQMILSFNRQALHAHLLGFTHPKTLEKLRFNSILSNDINELCSELDVK